MIVTKRAVKRQRVIIIGDSLAMPREGVPYESTYSGVLSKNMPDLEVINRAKRGNDAKKQSGIQSLFDDFEVFLPSVVIMQLGIVDCAPRVFGKKAGYIVSLLPNFIRSKLIAFFSEHRLFFTKHFPKTYVSKEQFKLGIERLLEMFSRQNTQVICISIAATTDSNNQKSFSFDKNISAYNAVQKELCEKYGFEYLDFYSVSKFTDYLLEDGIHINIKGHDYLANRLMCLLAKNS